MVGHSVWGKVCISAVAPVMVRSPMRTRTRSSMSWTVATALPSSAHGRESVNRPTTSRSSPSA